MSKSPIHELKSYLIEQKEKRVNELRHWAKLIQEPVLIEHIHLADSVYDRSSD
jgi:hypothetical protein